MSMRVALQGARTVQTSVTIPDMTEFFPDEINLPYGSRCNYTHNITYSCQLMHTLCIYLANISKFSV